MAETLLEELKRYVCFESDDEAALRALHPIAAPEFVRIASVFYDRILAHEGARTALEGGESQVGRLKPTLVAWMELLLTGPWDEAYYELRCRIGRVHVRIALPQHYMFGAMNVIRQELNEIIDRHHAARPVELRRARVALGKILDLELAIMLHTYREDLISQRARHERLSTFGQLVGSIGHELRNPLGVIESSLYILRGRVDSDDRALKHVNRISEQLLIANSIISSLLDMIRDRPIARERVEAAAILDQIAAILTAPPGVRLVVEGIAGLPAILADPGQLRQVFVNLIENALHAVGDRGEVHVAGRRKGDAVEIFVEDTGPGVDPEVRRRLFEPLVTNKAKGIGLGLALVKRIVERHGGTVSYEPAPAGGARFLVELPAGGEHA